MPIKTNCKGPQREQIISNQQIIYSISCGKTAFEYENLTKTDRRNVPNTHFIE